MTTDDTFSSVLDAARAGGDWAWERIYADHAPAVLGYLRAQRAHDPEDLLGEVFLQVVKGIARFEGDEAGFRAWVFRIARNRLIDDKRRRRRRPETQLDPSASLRPAREVVEEQADRELGADRVRALLNELSDDQRDVMLLRIIAGLNLAETAAVVEKRVGAVKALQHRALDRLRRLLQDRSVSP